MLAAQISTAPIFVPGLFADLDTHRPVPDVPLAVGSAGGSDRQPPGAEPRPADIIPFPADRVRARS